MANASAHPPKTLKSSKSTAPAFVQYYLFAYNVLSTIGWGYILVLTVVHVLNLDGKSSSIVSTESTASSTASRLFSFLKSTQKINSVGGFEARLNPLLVPFYRRAATTFGRVGVATTWIQTCATLEIIHVLLGWVRSSLQTTLMQVSSRLIIVWGIVEQFPSVRSNPLYASMVFAWSFTEVIRYSYYACNLIGYEPRMLLYLRYTTFYVLYPVGASSEAFLIYATLPSTSPIPSWSSWIMGMWKPTDYIRAICFVIWWPSLYSLYTHMIKQRRKVLGSGPSLSTKKTN